MNGILFTEAIAQERIWGGTALADRFAIPYQCEHPGEMVAAAGFPGHDTPLYRTGRTLSAFYAENPAYFGLSQPVFPLAVNLIDAKEKLSVQVHPTEQYARLHENCCGLPEAWVVIGTEGETELVAGHHGRSTEEFSQLARAGRWDQLLAVQSAQKGDCFVLPAGTVHAVGAGIQVYEVTHAADVVYRLYDYGRLEALSGLPRALHLDKATDVIYAPQKISKCTPAVLQSSDGIYVEELVDLPRVYTLRRIKTFNNAAYKQDPFGIYTVTDGAGTVNRLPIKAGTTFIAPCGGFPLHFQGELTCYMATYRE